MNSVNAKLKFPLFRIPHLSFSSEVVYYISSSRLIRDTSCRALHWLSKLLRHACKGIGIEVAARRVAAVVLDGGRLAMGVTLYVAGTGMALAAHSPSHCAGRYLKGDKHWAHIDVSHIAGMVVDMEIIDHDAVSNCGFIAIDHFYQSGNPRGKLAGKAARPDEE